MLSIILAANVAILLIIIATTSTIAMHRYDGYLEGLWTGDPGYLETAQLSDFQLYIGPRKHGKREAYLIMADPVGAFVANQAIEIEEPPARSRWLPALRNAFKSKRDAYTMHNVKFTFDSTGGVAAPMPSAMKLTLSILDGTLTLYDGDKIYAFLEKDIAASAAALGAAAE